MTPKVHRRSSRKRLTPQGSTSWQPTTCGAHVPASVTRPAVNSDQIQFLLGHVSIQTTEHYLGCKQKLRVAVNDKSASNRDAKGRITRPFPTTRG